MRTGFNWWYVTTIMSLVIVGVAGYLNTHEVDGRKRKKRLCGRFLLKVLTTILTVIFVVLVSTESYDGIVELCLDFCLSDGDSAAWADLLAFLAIGMTTIIFSEILENIVRFGSRLPVKPRCGRVYKCASSQRLAPDGTVHHVLSARNLRRILIQDEAYATGSTAQEVLRRIYRNRAAYEQRRLRSLEQDVLRIQQEQRRAVVGMTTVSCKTSVSAQPAQVIEIVPRLKQRNLPTEIRTLKALPVTPEQHRQLEELLSSAMAELNAAQQASVRQFFRERPDMIQVALSGQVRMTLRVTLQGHISVHEYARA